jgi:hypothetical protein
MKHLDDGADLHVEEMMTGIEIGAIASEEVAGSNGRKSEETQMTTGMGAKRDLKEAIGNNHLRPDGRQQAHQWQTSLG